jgi:hypothetical protein
MPTGEDLAMQEDHHHPDQKKLKSTINRELKKAHRIMGMFLDFLELIGSSYQSGRIDETRLAEFATENPRTKKKLFDALSPLVTLNGETISSERSTAAFAALVDLVERADRVSDPKQWRYNFSRLDLASISQCRYPDSEEIFQVFDPDERKILEAVHRYFLSKGYRYTFAEDGVRKWEIKYQGDRKKKGSPLFQIDYDERFYNPMRLFIKCAAVGRIAPLLKGFSESLRDDFYKRVHMCNEEKCGWCKDRKGLGPTVLTIEGEERNVCWYTRSEIDEVNDMTVLLIQEYEQLHSAL